MLTRRRFQKKKKKKKKNHNHFQDSQPIKGVPAKFSYLHLIFFIQFRAIIKPLFIYVFIP